MRRVEIRALSVLAAAALLTGCASRGPEVPDDEPTLASLKARDAAIDTRARAAAPPAQAVAQALAAYQAFLASPALPPRAPERVEAERRIADLEMDRAETLSADTGSAPDFRAAIAGYTAFLKDHPAAPDRDRVLYQLARAQDQGGDPAAALATLDRLVREHPATAARAEAEFRRGELLFTASRWADAEAAYAVVLQAPDETPFHERALYMQGWSRFKLGRLDDALAAFFAVLDRRLGGEPGSRPALTRADRELLEDSFRVIGLSLQSLDGARSIPQLITTPGREGYEPLVYRELAELYLKQERVKDAADTLAAFAERRPLHAQAPQMLSRVIEIHEKAGFTTLALQAKRDFVTRYGADSAFRQANPDGWTAAQPLVQAQLQTYLAELARHHHALAQKTGDPAEVEQAIRWYRAGLTAFPDAAESTENRFLLAELLFERQRWAEAGAEYAQVAYGDRTSATRGAEAGYAVLLAHAKQQPPAGDATEADWQRRGVVLALQFVDAYPADARATAVLNDAALKRLAFGDTPGADALAQRVLAAADATPAQRRSAWSVRADTAFDAGRWADAEAAYRELQAMAPGETAVTERLAAAIYKQGEAERAAGRPQAALGHFDRVAALAPQSAARATAEIDAAATRVALGDWSGAAAALEDFRRRNPQHPMTAEIPARLAAAYLELQRWGDAAVELERVAPTLTDPEAARDARWQVAALQRKAGNRAAEQQALERYVAQHPAPLPVAIEARQRLIDLADGDARRVAVLQQALIDAERNGGDARTARTQTLAAMATLALAEPKLAAYRAVALKEPLQRNLKLKQARLNVAQAALQQVADYGVPEAVTAATFHSAELFRAFGRALMDSERPKTLKKKAEREQYDVLLEEQAFPFEEKAIALHETNARRTTELPADPWVRRSLVALGELVPARWAAAAQAASNTATSPAPTGAKP
ncbi:tetratricopeptide repeat protein [Rubrivivax albus]|uniref:Tetratricopeptide repeat protein n=1 Tax=Rubrivivax albus TaxID=2499835 RepID=A0A437JSJ0_9BURK|nr:tetratricopeptide repeat protein [Rubrivivax albus]RVT50029.1 tetratricopeptide repeat protein [Rubrivivax albus]